MKVATVRWSTMVLVVGLAGAVVGAASGAAGDLDQSFGNGGMVVTDLGGNDGATAIADDPSGRIVVAGGTNAVGSFDFAVARYRPDGSLDPSFGNGGFVQTDFAGGFDLATALAVQNGKIIALGQTGVAFTSDFGLVRYKRDGSLDGSFGNGGKVTTDFGQVSPSSDAAGALAVEHGGKIVAAGGWFGNGSAGFAVARYRRDGSLDASFGTGGKVIVDFGPALSPSATGLLILPGGGIVVGGSSNFGGTASYSFTLALLRPDGMLDQSFGNGGIVTTSFGPGPLASLAILGDLVLQNGKIVAGGYALTAAGDAVFALARYDLAGNLDPSFGVGGKVLTGFAGTQAGIQGLALDGQLIVAAGYTTTNSATDFALARYLPDGSLDTSFGLGGRVTTDFGGIDFGTGVALEGNGVVVGGQTDVGGSNDFALARYLR
jgi:uncharacterized delta-60 repeat protein